MLKSNKEMRKSLSEFIANFKPDFIEEHEKKLESKIDDNTTLEGKFDLILASDKEYFVMDFKSSPKDYKEVLNYFGFDNQLQISLRFSSLKVFFKFVFSNYICQQFFTYNISRINKFFSVFTFQSL